VVRELAYYFQPGVIMPLDAVLHIGKKMPFAPPVIEFYILPLG